MIKTKTIQETEDGGVHNSLEEHQPNKVTRENQGEPRESPGPGRTKEGVVRCSGSQLGISGRLLIDFVAF